MHYTCYIHKLVHIDTNFYSIGDKVVHQWEKNEKLITRAHKE